LVIVASFKPPFCGSVRSSWTVPGSRSLAFHTGEGNAASELLEPTRLSKAILLALAPHRFRPLGAPFGDGSPPLVDLLCTVLNDVQTTM
jgi:hypothetical protein